MAKQTTRNNKGKQAVTPGAQKQSSSGRNLGKVIGAMCLLVFIMAEQLWIATAACALAFAVLFVMQVFMEKSVSWYASGYLYATAACAVLAYLEFSSQFISRLLDLGA